MAESIAGMNSRFLRFDELRKTVIEGLRKFNKGEYGRNCAEQVRMYNPVFKDAEFSEKLKAEGNRLYRQKTLNFSQLYKILITFNESIALAPKDSSQLAAAYANKSAVLLRMRKYKESISEIDKALKMTDLKALRIKMLCRKAECLTALGSSSNRSFLEKAKFIFAKIEESEKEKPLLDKLIKKTQSLIDKDSLDIPRDDRRKLQALKMVEEAEKRDLSESIQIQYSEKYGVHLVAARDIEPGDIILVEKPYLSRLDDSKAHQYCDHCLNHLWTAVPCDHCSRRLYCSEECKTNAWKEYHGIECYPLSHMIVSLESEWNKQTSFLLGFFFKAFQEAGSIKQMVADLEASNSLEDRNDSSTYFTSYKGVFTMPMNINQDDLNWCVRNSITILTGLAKYTKILGRSYDFKEMKKLMKDDTAIHVCALLLRFSIIFSSGCPTVHLADPNDKGSDLNNIISGKFDKDKQDEIHSQYNHCLPMLIIHTVSGCIPNVQDYHTYESKIVLCAIRPIKAGDQLVVISRSKSIWESYPKAERQLEYSNMYKSVCECRACTENWSDILDNDEKLAILLVAEMHCPLASKLWNTRNLIISDWKANCLKPTFPDLKLLSRAIDLVSVAWKRLPMPSLLIIRAMSSLVKILQAFYDPSEIYAKVPQLRLQEVGHIFKQSHHCSCQE